MMEIFLISLLYLKFSFKQPLQKKKTTKTKTKQQEKERDQIYIIKFGFK